MPRTFQSETNRAIRLVFLFFTMAIISGCSSSTEKKGVEATKAEDYINQAVKLSKNGADKSAMSELDKAISIDSKNVRALKIRGQLHEKLGEYEKAIEDFGVAVTVGGDDIETLLSIASIKRRQEKKEEAFQFAYRAFKVNVDKKNDQRILDACCGPFAEFVTGYDAFKEIDGLYPTCLVIIVTKSTTAGKDSLFALDLISKAQFRYTKFKIDLRGIMSVGGAEAIEKGKKEMVAYVKDMKAIIEEIK